MAKGGGASRPRLRLLPTVLLTAAILLLPTVIYGWGRSSSSFAIHEIRVTGTEIVPKQRALKLLRRDYLQHNLFTVTTKDVRRTLAGIRYVASASVDRDFPHTLRVRIVEHQPAAYALSEDRWYVIADSGFVIHELPPAEKTGGSGSSGETPTTGDQGESAGEAASTATASPEAETSSTAKANAKSTAKAAATLATLAAGPPHAQFALPRIAVAVPLEPGSTVDDDTVRAALPVIAGLSGDLRERLAVVQTSAEGQLTLRFDGGLKVTWGDTQRSLAKSLALDAVLERYAAAGTACTFADVSMPDTTLARPVLK